MLGLARVSLLTGPPHGRKGVSRAQAARCPPALFAKRTSISTCSNMMPMPDRVGGLPRLEENVQSTLLVGSAGVAYAQGQ